MVFIAPTHQITRRGDRVTIHSLELFVGFDPEVDSPDDKRMKKFTPERITEIVKTTNEFMNRGQRPKLILGHNTDDQDTPERPSIGDIISISEMDINGAPGIIGDVEMSSQDFDSFVASNQFPRRSAEIFPDGLLSEVALLGSRTPARPIPDTKFSSERPELFCRELPMVNLGAEKHAAPTEAPHSPGPGNTSIPSTVKKKKKDNQMPDDPNTPEKEAKDKNTSDDRIKALEDENEKLKAKLKATDDEKDKEKNDLQSKCDRFQRQSEESTKEVSELRDDFKKEKYSRKLDSLQAQGYGLDKERYAEILDRVCNSSDPDKELEFFTKLIPAGAVGVIIDQTQAKTGTNLENSPEEEARFSRIAKERCIAEKKPQMFSRYFDEAQRENK